MPNVYKPGLVQVRVKYDTEYDLDSPENVLWVLSSTGQTPISAGGIGDIQSAFDNYWAPMWASLGWSEASYIGSIVTDWTSATGEEQSSVGVMTPLNGSAGSAGMAAQAAALISYTQSIRYKGGHPRSYLPHLAQAIISGDAVIQNSYLETAETAFSSFLTQLGSIESAHGGPYNLVSYRFRDDSVNAHTQAITGFIFQPILATQRRRLRKVSRRA